MLVSRLRQKKSYDKPTVISLFTCGMGMDRGFEKAGFQTVYANDITKFACDTIRKVKKKEIKKRSFHLDEKSIFEIPSDKILENIGLEKGEADLIIGGPPCQSFSTAGMRKGIKDDRGRAVMEYIKKGERVPCRSKRRRANPPARNSPGSLCGRRRWRESFRYSKGRDRRWG